MIDMINKEAGDVNNPMNRLELIDIWKILLLLTLIVSRKRSNSRNRIHIFLKCAWNILYDRPSIGS